PEVMPLVPTRAFAAAQMLAALHTVDPSTIGLGREPRVPLDAEVGRWTRAFETLEERMHRGFREAEALLLEKMPPALPDAVCHGDYRLGNMLCDGADIAAVIDWEIWSVSDPRLDLAWFLFFTPEARHPMALNHGPTGLPSAAAMLDAYVTQAGVAPPNLQWFHALLPHKEPAPTGLSWEASLKANAAAGSRRG